MPRRLVLLHTVTSLVGLFTQLGREILPEDVEIVHVADEVLLKVVLDRGGLSPFAYRRVVDHAQAAEQMGAAAVLLTCSSISPCADAARPFVRIPVLKVDEPMVDEAVARGQRIGVAATAPTTLVPTVELVRARAALAGKAVTVDPMLCEGAYAAMTSGDLARHDEIVRGALRMLMARNDVVVLAQASMARVANTIPLEEQTVPVLSSPRLAMERARAVLESLQS